VAADSNPSPGPFPRDARLRTPRQFQNVFSQGSRFQEKGFRLHVRLATTIVQAKCARDTPRIGQSDAGLSTRSLAVGARLGISVPKRIASLAVERNRLRRIVRESFRRVRDRLPPGDYVLLALREATGGSSSALRGALDALWLRADALKRATCSPTMPNPAGSPPVVDRQLPPERSP
jgi:ribonuclease P protein component